MPSDGQFQDTGHKSDMSTEKQITPNLFDLHHTVQKFRALLGDTQQQFAARLGVSLVTIARWETSRTPSAPWLEKLAILAKKSGLDDYAEVFRKGKAEPRHGSGRPRQQVEEAPPEAKNEVELRFNLAVFRVLRNPKLYPKQHAILERTLQPVLRDMDQMLVAAQANMDVWHAAESLRQKGLSVEAIAESLSVNIDTLKWHFAMHDLREHLQQDKEQQGEQSK